MKIQSMTGFGEAEANGIKVEIRSTNHRFLDIHFRMPSFFNPHEPDMRKLIKERLSRGRIDVSISLTGDAKIKIGINSVLAEEILRTLGSLIRELSLKDEPSIDHLFWFREMLFTEVTEYDPEDLFNVFRTSLERLVIMREKEGEHLGEKISEMVKNLQRLHRETGGYAEEMLNRNFEHVKERISKLLGEIPVDESRLLQESAFLAERADISEELTRIESHNIQINRIISEGGTIGRRLDFLLQELMREINTIGSKSSEYRITDLVVLMKSEAEKIREQGQNIQ